MSYQLNSDLVVKRTAFYSNTLYNIQQLIRDTKDGNNNYASKWITNEDTETITKILTLLRLAELETTRRYQVVLSERTEDLKNSLEANHGND